MIFELLDQRVYDVNSAVLETGWVQARRAEESAWNRVEEMKLRVDEETNTTWDGAIARQASEPGTP
jgi:hypothetical protein